MYALQINKQVILSCHYFRTFKNDQKCFIKNLKPQ